MPRLGMNPNRGRSSDYRPSRVTLAVLTYLPVETGYFEARFEVTRLCLESLRAHTPPEYDLLVFDNGSAPRLTAYLQEAFAAGRIDYLLLSRRNVGKINALRTIARVAPGEILAYTDDDVFFLPGWLDAHLQILETFPQAGLVTGFYIRSHMRYALQSAQRLLARPDVQVRRGLLNDETWEAHYRQQMGRSVEAYRQEVGGLEDVEVTLDGVSAFLSAGHHQFVAPRRVLLEALGEDWDEALMGGMVTLEERLDTAGYLRLSTRQPVTRLLGNRVDAETAALAASFGLNARFAPPPQALPPLVSWLMRYSRVRRQVRRWQSTLFHWLEASKKGGA